MDLVVPKDNILNLFNISRKKERKIIGLMSGTSLDGLDVAYCNFNGNGLETVVKLERFRTVPYSDEIKKEIRKLFGKKNVNLQDLCILNGWIGTLHAEIVLNCLDDWNIKSTDIDVIASHGQTIFHAPKRYHNLEKFGNSTLQIGDGDHIAVKTGIITLSDFRQKNIAAGFEGAPLALYGDAILFSKEGENRILLNIGGIANFTYLPGNMRFSDVLSTDTGPGNTLLDMFSMELFSQEYDDNGRMADIGCVNTLLLEELKSHNFFSQKLPKTTGPELFNVEYVREAQKKTSTENLSSHDLMATLTHFTAETIAVAIECAVEYKNNKDCSNEMQKLVIYPSGGGCHNTHLLSLLQRYLSNYEFHQNMDVLGIPGDAKEAVLFATLANECVSGERCFEESVFNLSMGKVSFPV